VGIFWVESSSKSFIEIWAASAPLPGMVARFLAVEGGDGVGEAHDDRLGVGGGQELFGFALVEELVHGILW
jgi:hypothetical protein